MRNAFALNLQPVIRRAIPVEIVDLPTQSRLLLLDPAEKLIARLSCFWSRSFVGSEREPNHPFALCIIARNPTPPRQGLELQPNLIAGRGVG
jgi:hypothetical protein